MIPVNEYFARRHLGHQLTVRQKKEGPTDFWETLVLKCTECWIDPDEMSEDFGDDPGDWPDEETQGLYYHATLLDARADDDYFEELLSHDRHLLCLSGPDLICLTESSRIVGEIVPTKRY
jgi:hypothetical protein